MDLRYLKTLTLFSMCRSFENNLSTYRLLASQTARSELQNVSATANKHHKKMKNTNKPEIHSFNFFNASFPTAALRFVH